MTRLDLAARQLSEQADFTKNISEQFEAAKSMQTAGMAEASGSARYSQRYAGAQDDSCEGLSAAELVQSGRDDGAYLRRGSQQHGQTAGSAFP